MASLLNPAPEPARRIPVARPMIDESDVEAVAEAVRTGWGPNAYKYQAAFEAAFANACGRAHGLALPSCTSGLHLALAALGVGPGDEVVLPDVTWIASAAPARYLGATLVFADVDPVSLCITPETLDAVVTDRTRAAVVVDLYGDMPDWAGLSALADARGFALVEDAAEAIGGRFRGRPAGSFGVASAFSFHGSKTLTTGEGGMLVLDDDRLLDRCRRLADHGRTPGDRTFRNQEVGFKYKMSATQAALGLSQLARVDRLVASKRRIFERYRNRLDGLPGCRLNRVANDVDNGFWMVTLTTDSATGLTKQRLAAELDRAGIDTRPVFDPLSSLQAFEGSPESARARERNVNAYAVTPFGINLPSGPDLADDDIDRACDAVAAALDCATADSRRRTR